jgi:hypothetical protein
MVELDQQEAEIAMMALQFTEWRLDKQISGGVSADCSDAAWYVAKFCRAKVEALIAKIADAANKEKSDG